MGLRVRPHSGATSFGCDLIRVQPILGVRCFGATYIGIRGRSILDLGATYLGFKGPLS